MNTSRIPVWICLLIGGLLSTTARATIPADFDGDGDVDSADLDLFEGCASSPGVPYATGCNGKDLDTDGDVDQADFGIFQLSWGSGVPMVLIPAGEFQMGDTFNEGYSAERPAHTVNLDAFFIDRAEVTNQQYADALNWAKSQGNLITVGGGVVYKYNTSYPYCLTTPTYGASRITWNGSTFGVVAGKESRPMTVVSWYGSVAYANWRSGMQGKPLCYDLSTWSCNWNSGYRLPTEAEWEKAARGSTVGHRFPWSDTDTIQHARANYYSSTAYPYDNSPTRGYHPTFFTGGAPFTSPVGYFAANGYGLYDMAGNVSEWCNDWYSDTYYSSSPYDNPRGPTIASYRVYRGGAWSTDAYICRVAFRGGNIPGSCGDTTGLRLVLDSP